MLTFLPKTGVKLPEKKRMDRLLNRLEGRAWIDSENYSLLKVDMHLTEPTTLMGGLGETSAASISLLKWCRSPRTFSSPGDQNRLRRTPTI